MKFILGVIVFLLLQAGCFCHTIKTVNGKQHVFTNIFHTPHLFQSPCCLIKCLLLIYAPSTLTCFDAFRALHNSCFSCSCVLLALYVLLIYMYYVVTCSMCLARFVLLHPFVTFHTLKFT